ncbi:MAG TPA: hypothetical protein VGL37_08530 [Solirubrobacteraceae bacterium]
MFATFVIALSATATASAGGGVNKIFEDCGESKIPVGFNQQTYEQALKQMPPELAEYDDCPALIHKAQRAGAGEHGNDAAAGAGGGSTGTVPPPTPAEQQTLEKISRSSGAPVKVGEEIIHPGVVHVNIASAVGQLPTPLLALLAFLLACALLILGRLAFVRARARRDDA